MSNMVICCYYILVLNVSQLLIMLLLFFIYLQSELADLSVEGLCPVKSAPSHGYVWKYVFGAQPYCSLKVRND